MSLDPSGIPEKISGDKGISGTKKSEGYSIGLAGYYRKFIENFSKIVKPLTKLMKKTERFV